MNSRRLLSILVAVLLLVQAMPVAAVSALANTLIVSQPIGGETYYEVTFQLGDSAADIKQLVKSGESPVIPQPPAAPVGERFVGWFAGEAEYTAQTQITADVTLSPRFAAVGTVTVTIEYLDATTKVSVYQSVTRTYVLGERVTERIVSPTSIAHLVPSQEAVTYHVEDLTENTVYTVTYGEATAQYTVNYLFEEIEPGKYGQLDAYPAVTKDGIEGAHAAAVPISAPEGYSFARADENVTVLSDHSAVVNVYYDRNTNFLVFDSKGGVPVGSVTARYGEPVTLPTATRMGYVFAGWYSDDRLSQAAPTAMPAAHTTILRAKWTGDKVNYTIVRWLEKANVTGTPNMQSSGQWAYLDQTSATGIAGTRIDSVAAAQKAPLTARQVNGTTGDGKAINVAEYFGLTPIAELSGDGTGVLNVYFKRTDFRYTFNTTANYMFNLNGADYLTGRYTFTAKYEQDLSRLWPSSHNATFYVRAGSAWVPTTTTSFISWTSSDIVTTSAFATHRWTLTDEMLPKTNGMTSVNMTANYDTTVRKTVNYWAQVVPGDEIADHPGYVDSTVYQDQTYWKHPASQFLAQKSTTALSAKQLEGFHYAAGNSGAIATVYNFYYTRLAFALGFDTLGGADIAPIANVPHEKMLSDLDPKWDASVTKVVDGVTYRFAGWYFEADCMNPFNFATEKMPNKNLTVFAKWTKEAVPVTVDPNYPGSATATVMLNVGDTIAGRSAITAPTRPGNWAFSGWYRDARCSVPFSVYEQIGAATTLYAGWVAATTSYTVHYIAYVGDDPTHAAVTVYPAKTVTGQSVGSSVRETALAVGDARVNHREQSLTLSLDPSENVITFVYYSLKIVNYTLRHHCYGADGWAVYASDTKPIVMPTVMRVVEYPISIPGHYPTKTSESLVLSTTESENTIDFYYLPWVSVPYAVEHYYQSEGGAYVLDSELTETGSARIGNTVPAVKKPGRYHVFTHSTQRLPRSANWADVAWSGDIPNPNPIIIEMYYDLAPDVTINYVSEDAAKGTVSPAGETLAPASGVAVGSTAAASAGYSFTNWTNGAGEIVSGRADFVPAKVGGLNVADTYTAHFTENTNTPYLVEHHQQNPGAATYALVQGDTEALTGTTGALAKFTPKSYAGFAYEASKTTPRDPVILKDGSLVIKLYYARNTPTPSPMPTPSPTPNPTPTPTPSPTEDPTPGPTEDPTPDPTEDPTPGPIPTPTRAPNPTAAPTPGPMPTTPALVPEVTPPEMPEASPDQAIEPTPPTAPEPTPGPTPILLPPSVPENLAQDLGGQLRNDTRRRVEQMATVEDMNIPLAGIASRNVGDCFE